MSVKICIYCFYLYGKACGDPTTCLLDGQEVEAPEESSCQGWYPNKKYHEEMAAQKQANFALQEGPP